jgi:hypothetical protein
MAIEPNIFSRAAQSGFGSRMWLGSRSLATNGLDYSRLSQNQKVHYHVQKSSPVGLNMSQTN